MEKALQPSQDENLQSPDSQSWTENTPSAPPLCSVLSQHRIFTNLQGSHILLPHRQIPAVKQEQISHTKHSMFQTPVQTCPSLSMFVFMELLPDRKERECLTHPDSSSQGKLSPAAPADLQGARRALHHCSPVPGSTRAPYEKRRSCYQHLNLGKSGTMRVDKKRGATVLHPTNSSFHILSAPSGTCPQSRPPPACQAQLYSPFSKAPFKATKLHQEFWGSCQSSGDSQTSKPGPTSNQYA